MANIKQQKKRIITSAKANQINKAKRIRIKNLNKEYLSFIVAKDVATAEAVLPELVSHLMKSNTMHRKASSRKIANATKLLDNLKKELAQ